MMHLADNCWVNVDQSCGCCTREEVSKEAGGSFDAFSSGSLVCVEPSRKSIQGSYFQLRLDNGVGTFLFNSL